jgi:hypothetical protein
MKSSPSLLDRLQTSGTLLLHRFWGEADFTSWNTQRG